MFQVVTKRMTNNGKTYCINWEYFSTWDEVMRYLSQSKFKLENVIDIVRIRIMGEDTDE